MDLIQKSIVAVAAVVFVIFALFYLQSNGIFAQQLTSEQAVALVYHDLQNANPSASINVTNVTQSQYIGSWHIVLSIILNATSPCPSYFIYSFDYPKYGFVYRVENTYTNNCVIYGNQGSSQVIGSAPAAITRVYNINDSMISQYIRQYGYANITTGAFYQTSVQYDGTRYPNVWVVTYGSAKTNYSVISLISQLNGTALGIYKS